MSVRRKLHKYPNSCFVETGTAKGDGIADALMCGFTDVRSVEIHKPFFECCDARYKDDRRVHLYLGDSVKWLEDMIRHVRTPITFWLDGHFSVGTGAQFDDDSGMTKCCPVLEELKIIANHPIRTHTILIDDRRLLRASSNGGRDGIFGVTEQEVREMLLRINPGYTFGYEDGHQGDDILVAIPPHPFHLFAHFGPQCIPPVPAYGSVTPPGPPIRGLEYFPLNRKYSCVVVDHWAGGLGNRIVQIIHALSVAERSNTPVLFPPLRAYLDSTNLIVPDGGRKRGNKWIGGHFFYGFNVNNQCKRDLALQYLWPAMSANIPRTCDLLARSARDTVVIHVRGGDMYKMGGISEGNVDPKSSNGVAMYTQPGRSYYDAALAAAAPFSTVFVVTNSKAFCSEDAPNPMVKYLADKYNAQILDGRSEEEDFHMMLSAVNMIAANSTFSLVPLYLSQSLKRYWCPEGMLGLVPACTLFSGSVEGIEIHEVPLNENHGGASRT